MVISHDLENKIRNGQHGFPSTVLEIYFQWIFHSHNWSALILSFDILLFGNTRTLYLRFEQRVDGEGRRARDLRNQVHKAAGARVLGRQQQRDLDRRQRARSGGRSR
jgi:hypothetical protein